METQTTITLKLGNQTHEFIVGLTKFDRLRCDFKVLSPDNHILIDGFTSNHEFYVQRQVREMYYIYHLIEKKLKSAIKKIGVQIY